MLVKLNLKLEHFSTQYSCLFLSELGKPHFETTAALEALMYVFKNTPHKIGSKFTDCIKLSH